MVQNDKTILSIGGTGLIGSRVSELLGSKYKFHNLGSSEVDVTDVDSVEKLSRNDFDIVLLLAAIADIEKCEEEKELREESVSWKINVNGVENVAKFCERLGKKIIFVSTDFVFDGNLPLGVGYTEKDLPNPVNWYAHTKWMGEEKVKESGCQYIIVRPAYPYRAHFEKKSDFVRTIVEKMEKREEIKAISDHIFCPTFIDDFAMALDVLIKCDASGIYHTVGKSALTPFDAANLIAQKFDLDKTLIQPITRKEFFQGRATRPYNLTLKNGKIESLGMEMRTFEEGLVEVKKQIL